jgi:hypothetical protein
MFRANVLLDCFWVIVGNALLIHGILEDSWLSFAGAAFFQALGIIAMYDTVANKFYRDGFAGKDKEVW